MSKLLSICVILVVSSVVFGQAQTAQKFLDAPFSQLTSSVPDGSVRHCINCLQTNPCTASTNGTQATAQKLNGVWNCSGSGTAGGVTAISGTTNQVNTSASSGNVTLSTPQNINTTATPRFNGLGIGATAGSTGINLIGPLKPNANSTTAVQITKADGTTAVVNVDTSNSRLGVGLTPSRALDVFDSTGSQLRLTQSALTNYADFSVNSGGTLTLTSTGNLLLDPIGNQIDPVTNYDLNLGELSKKYLTINAAELWVETLVAQNTAATFGGRIIVAPSNILIADMAPAATSIDVKYNNFTSGDTIYMESSGKVEFMAVTSGSTIISGGFRYNVTRNLDGTGANQWYAGDSSVDTGNTGNGFIDLYSVRGISTAAQAGPTIVGNVRNTTTYNDWSETWAIGNLKGLYGYGADTYGVGLGKYAAGTPHVTIDATNGYRIYSGLSTVIGSWDNSGVITIGEVGASKDNIRISSGAISIRNNTTERIGMTTAGSMTIKDSAGNAVLTFDASTGAEITRKLTMPGSTSAIAIGTTPPTSASVGTGIWLDRTGLFGLASSVLQVKIDATTGQLVGGAGAVTLGAGGIVLAAGTSVPNTLQIGTGIIYGSTTKLNILNTAGDIYIGDQATGTPSVAPTLHLRPAGGSASFYNVTGLRIALADGTPSASTALEITSTTGAVLFPRMTSTQRDALTPINGMVLYNSTTDKLQVRAAGSWVDLH